MQENLKQKKKPEDSKEKQLQPRLRKIVKMMLPELLKMPPMLLEKSKQRLKKQMPLKRRELPMKLLDSRKREKKMQKKRLTLLQDKRGLTMRHLLKLRD